MTKADPITVEVIGGSLIFAAEEMGIALRNSAFSPNIRERMDHSCAMFDARRRMIAQAEHIPVHLGSMPWALAKGLGNFKRKIEEGDMILFNDPYLSGTHLPDITLICPIFHEGKTVAYSINKAHHSDVGGRAPGSMAADATELYQEGIIIPPVKLVEGGRVNEDLLRLITRNTRTPKARRGDLKAQIAANLLGGRRVSELLNKYGVSVFNSAIDGILDSSERMMRKALSMIPRGVYEAEDYLEGTGVSRRRVRIRTRVEVKEGGVEVDFSGTDEQVDVAMNAVVGVTLSAVYYVLKCLTGPELAFNEGCCRPVKVRIPRGTVLNPVPPAAVAGGNVETSQRIVDVLFKALSQAVPDKVSAASQGTMNNVSIGGVDPKTGEMWSFYETVAGGMGGRPGLDGEDGVHTHMTNTMNTPIEVVELQYPLRCLKYGLRADSGGAGRWRGGVGVERVWMILAPSATISILAERKEIAPWGLFGGKPGATAEFKLRKADGTEIELGAKETMSVGKGDVLIIRTPGGGGYGPPSERDAKLITEDILDGLVSPRVAREDYQLVGGGRNSQKSYE